MDVMEAIRQRFSCRVFSSREVSSEVIGDLLEAARWAPSAGNLQPVRMVVVRDRRCRRALGDADFGFETSAFYQDEVELPFFRHDLKGEGELEQPEALVFETGANRWRRFDTWPPPGKVTHLHHELHDIFHTFLKGHRIMVQVQSTWFPFIDRNPGTWVPNILEARAGDFVPVTNRVYHTAEHPSALEIRVLH